MAQIAPNWNAGGWADNGPGTGGWDPNDASTGGSINAPTSSDTFDDQKYNIKNMQYPDDLLSNRAEYGKNYVVFYINVAADSKLIRDQKVGTVDDFTPRENSTLVGQAQRLDLSRTQVAGIQIGAGFALGALGQSSYAGAAIGAVGAGAVATQTSQFQGKTKRLKTAIALHMPNLGVAPRYAVTYDEKNMAVEGAIIETLGASSSLVKSIMGGSTPDVEQFKNALPTGAAANIALSTPGGDIAQKLGGIAPNPRREQLFRQVEFRTFQMRFEFYPRDKKEAENVKNIIREFKYHMHPEYKDTNAFLYVYPSEFDIIYYHGTEENTNIHKHTSCVLTELAVNYEPQGQFTAFDDGTPTQMNIDLTFKELVPLTKETIEKGL